MIELGIDCNGETNKKHLDSISFNKETKIRWDFNQGDRIIQIFLVTRFISIRNILIFIVIETFLCVIRFYIHSSYKKIIIGILIIKLYIYTR